MDAALIEREGSLINIRGAVTEDTKSRMKIPIVAGLCFSIRTGYQIVRTLCKLGSRGSNSDCRNQGPVSFRLDDSRLINQHSLQGKHGGFLVRNEVIIAYVGRLGMSIPPQCRRVVPSEVCR